MKFSIVTISFNQAQFIEETINTVLNQKGVDIEYIIVDPGSTDGSRDIIDKYASKVIRIYEKDTGAADGLNKGFAKATGDIFCYINSDDVFYPDALENVRKYFEKYSDIDVVSGSGLFIDENGNEIGKITPSKFSAWLYAYGAVTLFQQGTFFRKSAYIKSGGFNAKNKICWDGENFVDMFLAGAKFGVLNNTLAGFRMYGSNISSTDTYRIKLKEENCRLFKKIIGRTPRRADLYIKKIARIIKLMDASYIFNRLCSNNFQKPPHLRKQ